LFCKHCTAGSPLTRFVGLKDLERKSNFDFLFVAVLVVVVAAAVASSNVVVVVVVGEEEKQVKFRLLVKKSCL